MALLAAARISDRAIAAAATVRHGPMRNLFDRPFSTSAPIRCHNLHSIVTKGTLLCHHSAVQDPLQRRKGFVHKPDLSGRDSDSASRDYSALEAGVAAAALALIVFTGYATGRWLG